MTSNFFNSEAFADVTEEVVIALIEFDSDELDEPVRISRDPYQRLPDLGEDVYGCISNGVTYVFIPFEIWLPRDDETGSVSCRIEIDNVEREIIKTVRSIKKPVTGNLKVVLSSDVDNVERQYSDLELRNVNYDALSVKGDLTFNYWELEPFPSSSFTPAGFPGMF